MHSGDETRADAGHRPNRVRGDNLPASGMPADEFDLLSVEKLRTEFHTKSGVVRAVKDVSFSIRRGEVVGIVGESGCGKSVTALSILGLIRPPGEIVSGRVLFEGQDLVGAPNRTLRRIRGKEIAMIFQNPLSALNPVLTIGFQIEEAILEHDHIGRRSARKRALDLLQRVGIPDAEGRLSQYPHQFSGGMAQRAMIAMALANRPKLLIADESTTALDVTIQAQILRLLRRMSDELGMAVLFITHNMGIVLENCDQTLVMYAGKIVEMGKTDDVFRRPLHPYTKALLACVPELKGERRDLIPLEGYPPDLTVEGRGCDFEPRCAERFDRCLVEIPETCDVEAGHAVRCHLY